MLKEVVADTATVAAASIYKMFTHQSTGRCWMQLHQFVFGEHHAEPGTVNSVHTALSCESLRKCQSRPTL